MKIRFAKIVQRVSHVSGVSTFLSQRQPVMRIIMFHGVSDHDYPAGLLEEHLRYLARNFSVVHINDLVTRMTDPEYRPRREVALTFDDGLRNNYTIAYPILKKLSLPATFFICPGLVENRRWLWNHEARQRLLYMTSGKRRQLCRMNNLPRINVEEIVEWMKALPYDERLVVEQTIRDMSRHFRPSRREHEMFDIMTWKDLRKISPDLVTIGSHTVNHPILTTLDRKSLEYEINGSRHCLEERLQRPVKFFCDPNGSNDSDALRIIRKNYVAAFTTRKGFVRFGDDLHNLNRIPAANSLGLFSWRMLRPRS